RVCSYLPLGLVEYGEAFRLQRAIAAARASGEFPDTLITLEHPPVLTLGRRAKQSNIVVPESMLRAEGVSVYNSTRGGDVTYHGPGQLVGYPILGIRALGLGASAYVHSLETAIIDLLAHFGIQGRQDPHYIGVWVGDEKVSAIGVAISGGVTTHGFALNVNPNMAHFRLINPCGITDKGVTSMARLLGRPITVSEVRPVMVESLAKVFGLKMEIADPARLAGVGISLPSVSPATM
ncbi:MAG TPA: lipoyl(octanoyl) transferase LipB, partial [Chloroflexota bacterium]|nr:lipoyl(octanoyl) transferase LipB [Chloroflexota bacterium]